MSFDVPLFFTDIRSNLTKPHTDIMNNTSQPNTDIATEMGVNPNDPSMSFLKKDYRKVMKALDKKQGKV